MNGRVDSAKKSLSAVLNAYYFALVVVKNNLLMGDEVVYFAKSMY